MRRHNVDLHCYVEDTQFHVPLKPGSANAWRVISCLAGIKNWLSKNFLPLHDFKSEVTVITPSGSSTTDINKCSSSLGALSNNVWKEAHNLGVIFDSELSFDMQVTKVLQSCFALLRQLSTIRSFLSPADSEKVIHAFVTSRLEYCNTLYSGISKQNIHRLQLIQDAAARLLTGTRRCKHITPVLVSINRLYIHCM